MNKKIKFPIILTILITLLCGVFYFLYGVNHDKQKYQKLISRDILQDVNFIILCSYNTSNQLEEVHKSRTISKIRAEKISDCFTTISESFTYLNRVREEIYGDEIIDRNRLDILMNGMGHYI